jgi:hypothetical protein
MTAMREIFGRPLHAHCCRQNTKPKMLVCNLSEMIGRNAKYLQLAYSVEKLYFLETLKSCQKQLLWKTQLIFIALAIQGLHSERSGKKGLPLHPSKYNLPVRLKLFLAP